MGAGGAWKSGAGGVTRVGGAGWVDGIGGSGPDCAAGQAGTYVSCCWGVAGKG